MRVLIVLGAVIVALFWIYASLAQTDLDPPSGPSDYAAGFFAMDARGLSDTVWEQWFSPGEEFCRAWQGHNCDGTPSTALQASSARATWEAMTQCNRLRLRAFHRAELRWPHDVVGEKVQVLFLSSVPLSKRSQYEACLTQNVFEFIGRKFSTACSALNAHTAGLCGHFFAGETMGTVVFGWESASE